MNTGESTNNLEPEEISTPGSTLTPNSESVEDSFKQQKRLTSTVWGDFERIHEDGIWKVVCRHCHKKLKANKGTKALHNHLDMYCSKKRRKTTDNQQKLLTSIPTGDGKVMINSFTFDQDTSREDLARAITMHEYPLSIVEHIGFRKFVSGLQPLFKMPKSRNTVRSDLIKLSQSKKTKLFIALDKIPSRIAITTDMWTSRQKKGYMSVTGHYIDDAWCLRDLLLGFAYVPTPHTSTAICDVLMVYLLDWNIDRKVSTITVDNCTTNNAMIRDLKERLGLSSLLLNGEIVHMRCGAHILNLIVQEGLLKIKPSIKKIRGNVSYWTATPSREQMFEKACRDLKIPFTKKMMLDCKTRWNSTFLMLETVLSYRDVFPRLRLREKDKTPLPSEAEWMLAQEICQRLKLFHSITGIFSGTQFPTTNCLFPKICEVKLALNNWRDSSSGTINLMAAATIKKFDEYWGESHLIAGIAIILDPRYKKKFLEHVLGKIYGELTCVTYVDGVVDACNGLFLEYELKYKSSDELSQSGGDTISIDSGMAAYDIFSEYDLLVNASKPVNSKSELDQYIEEKVYPRTPDFDILNWWKANGKKYPILQLIARDILSIPVSTVASESAFSTSGRIMSPHRSRLGADILEAFMCTRDWSWNSLRGDSSSAVRLQYVMKKMFKENERWNLMFYESMKSLEM